MRQSAPRTTRFPGRALQSAGEPCGRLRTRLRSTSAYGGLKNQIQIVPRALDSKFLSCVHVVSPKTLRKRLQRGIFYCFPAVLLAVFARRRQMEPIFSCEAAHYSKFLSANTNLTQAEGSDLVRGRGLSRGVPHVQLGGSYLVRGRGHLRFTRSSRTLRCGRANPKVAVLRFELLVKRTLRCGWADLRLLGTRAKAVRGLRRRVMAAQTTCRNGSKDF